MLDDLLGRVDPAGTRFRIRTGLIHEEELKDEVDDENAVDEAIHLWQTDRGSAHGPSMHGGPSVAAHDEEPVNFGPARGCVQEGDLQGTPLGVGGEREQRLWVVRRTSNGVTIAVNRSANIVTTSQYCAAFE